MATSNKQHYILCVDSADVTPWTKSQPDNDPRELYMEIKVDQMSVFAMKAVEGSGHLHWKETSIITGNSTSTLSLSIGQSVSAHVTQDTSIGCVDVLLGTLLARWESDNLDFVALELASVAIEAKESIMGIIKVMLNGNPDDVALTMERLGAGLLHRFEQTGSLCDLEEALSYRAGAVELTDEGHANKSGYLSNLGNTQRIRFERLGDLSDLTNAISNMERALSLTDDGHAYRAMYLLNLGNAQQLRFERLDNMSDLGNAILNKEKVLALIDDAHPDRPGYFSILASAQQIRFERLGDLPDLTNAISNMEKALSLINDGHADHTMYLSKLGNMQQTCFEQLGNISDLDNAISNHEKAVRVTDDGHANKSGYLCNLGNTQRIRFQRLGDLHDLTNAISNMEKALSLIDDGHVYHAMYLSNLSNAQQLRFECLGNLSDLANAILNTETALALTDDAHPDRPRYLASLGTAQLIRFERLGDLSDLDKAISNQEKSVELADEGRDEGRPDQPIYLKNLGNVQLIRFKRLGNMSDLDNAISTHEKAIRLTDDGHQNKPGRLSSLGFAYQSRFERLGNMSDLEHSISNNEKAVDLTDDRHLYRPMYLTNLGSAQQTCFECTGKLLELQNAISNKQKALALTEDGHPYQPAYLSNLGVAQLARFDRLGDLSDIDDAILHIGQAVELTGSGHLNQPGYLMNLGIAQQARFERLGNMPDLENAISNKARAVELTDDAHPSKPTYLSNLGAAQQTRFERLGEFLDLENAISNKQRAVELTDDGHLAYPMYLTNLGISQKARFKLFGHLSDLENAISSKEQAVQLTDDAHPNRPLYLSNLGIAQHARFDRLGDLSDLENAILHIGQAVDLTDDNHPLKAGHLTNLGVAYYFRFDRLGSQEDLVTSVSLYKSAAQLNAAYPLNALAAARQWAITSHLYGEIASALDGYRTALELLPKVAWLGLDTPSRQARVKLEKLEDLGCLAATCAIHLGRLEEAVELLDLGRSIFWQQAGSLRSDLEILKDDEPELVAELQRVGHQLDADSFSRSQFTIKEESLGHHQLSAETIGRERRRLVGQWEGLVGRVRQLPHFKYFLKPVPFDQLCRASTEGLIVIINASEYGVDALIFGASRPIEHVSLPNINLELLAELSGDILHRRSASATGEMRRNYAARYLKSALRIVWDDILVPIFNKLDVPLTPSPAAPQRRIWWYPTGPLTFIPFHAAGPGHRGAIDASHLIISSYVTSLESLLQAQKRNMQGAMSGLKLLAVSQPSTPGLNPLPQSTVEVEKLVEAAHFARVHSDGCTEVDILHLPGPDATVSRVLDALDSYPWVHFACHGSHHPTLGMKNALELYDGPLELGDIASKRLSSARFAFLSACHAAAGLKDVPGEAMHLAAGLQFAGFPSVVATMWSISDDDAAKVVDHTYKYLFRNGLQALDPSEAATALNRAILHLREDPGVTVDRWAPFIHFGI